MIYATVLVADAIVFEASLSFLNAGIKSVNTLTWGNMLSEGKELLLSGHWWPTFFPGLMILITTLCLNVLSEGLTDVIASSFIRTRVDAADVEADEEAMRAREAAAGDGADDAKAVGADAGPGPAPESAGGAAGTVPLAEHLATLHAAELAH